MVKKFENHIAEDIVLRSVKESGRQEEFAS